MFRLHLILCNLHFILKKQLSIFNYHIRQAANNIVEINIDGEIVDASTHAMLKEYWGDDTSVCFKSFREEIAKNPSNHYRITINSPGGHVGDAMAMHDYIQQLRKDGKTVETIGTGIVASAGTYILMAGDNPTMTANSWFLIHNVSGFFWGDVNEFENYTTSLRKFNDKSRDFYSSFTGLRKEEITKIMNAGQFLTADEAKEKGFIKEVSESVNFTQKINADKWEFENTAVLQAYNSNVSIENNIIDNLKKDLSDMKKSFTNFLNNFKASKPENAEAETIVNSITVLLDPMLEELSGEIDTAVASQITEMRSALVTEITNSVTTSLNQEIVNLKKANSDLQLEFENKIGKPTNSNNGEQAKVTVGDFVDAN